MKKVFTYLVALLLALPFTIKADLVNPATLLIKEVSPSNFQIVFTLPLINGKVLKAMPILPDALVIKGDMEEKGISGSVVRTWNAECNPADLVGQPIGIKGLLGTSQQIQLTLETLDGRQYVQVLQPTKSYFVIPSPPSFFNMLYESGIRGMQLVLNRFELVIFIVLLALLNLRTRDLVYGILAFALAQSTGQWLAAQFWAVMSIYLPAAFTAFTSAFMVYGIISSYSEKVKESYRTLWIVMLLLGFCYGAAQPQTNFIEGLSNIENYLVSLFTATGTGLGFVIVLLLMKEFKILAEIFAKDREARIIYYTIYIIGIVSTSIFIYEISTPFFIVSSEPSIPLFVLITIATLGVWSKLKIKSFSLLFVILPILTAVTGITMSLNGVIMPFSSLIVYGFTAFLGITLLLNRNMPNWLIMFVLLISILFTGNYAGFQLQQYSTLPIANSVGMTALLVLIFYTIYILTPAGKGISVSNRGIIFIGAVSALLAVLWRFVEYGDWFKSELASSLSMGFFPLPLITLLLLVAAVVSWPRKRAFKVSENEKKEVRQWVILITAFFMVPIGNVQVSNPFSNPGAPSSTEASYIMEDLLSGTYLAFNQKDENDAFDQLQDNLADDLVSDVYLDSRRRLTAGTRQGAVITVRDVSVMSVDSLKSTYKSNRSYTYPCKWVVTARVKHLKHIHDRQNIYFGDLTIRVEDNKWKITKLVLKREEREILPFQTTS